MLLAIGVGFSVIQRLLDYELLLTQDIVSWAVALGIGLVCLGAMLTFLGFGATDPKYLKKLKKERL